MMPLLSPSRLVVLVISLSLFTFLWTLGMPRGTVEPVLPSVHHEPLGQKPEQAASSVAGDGTAITTATTRIGATATLAVTATMVGGQGSGGTGEQAEEHNKQDGTPSTAAVPYPTGKNTTSPAHGNNTATTGQSCKDARGASDILLILQTTKSADPSHLATRLTTLLTCVPNFTIYSDHSGLLGNHTIHDALALISASTKSSHDEFKAYEKARSQPDAHTAVPAELDRWTLLPTLYHAYTSHPDMRFYVLLPPTATLLFSNLLTWTTRLDARIPYYIGAPLTFGSTKFAQSRAGILLSNAAMRQYVKAYNERYEREWEDRIANTCCGDVMLAEAMRDANVEFSAAWPIMQTEPPVKTTWTRKIWCAPAVSFGAITPSSVTQLHDFEANWTRAHGREKPMLNRDVFAAIVQPRLLERAGDWDNLSSDTKVVKPSLDPSDLSNKGTQEWFGLSDAMRNATASSDACGSYCEGERACLQWRYKKGECHLGNSVMLGKAGKKGEGWTSGWLVERARKVMAEWDCEGGVAWGFGQF